MTIEEKIKGKVVLKTKYLSAHHGRNVEYVKLSDVLALLKDQVVVPKDKLRGLLQCWRHECIKCRNIWFSFKRFDLCPKCSNNLQNMHNKMPFESCEKKLEELTK